MSNLKPVSTIERDFLAAIGETPAEHQKQLAERFWKKSYGKAHATEKRVNVLTSIVMLSVALRRLTPPQISSRGSRSQRSCGYQTLTFSSCASGSATAVRLARASTSPTYSCVSIATRSATPTTPSCTCRSAPLRAQRSQGSRRFVSPTFTSAKTVWRQPSANQNHHPQSRQISCHVEPRRKRQRPCRNCYHLGWSPRRRSPLW